VAQFKIPIPWKTVVTTDPVLTQPTTAPINYTVKPAVL